MTFPRYSYEKFLRNQSLFRSWLEVTPLEWADLDVRDLAELTDTVSIDCPAPPSVNALWRHGKGNTYITAEYRRWRQHFDSIIMAMRPRPKIEGKFVAIIALNEDKIRKGSDPDNRIKAVLDALQRTGVIENDKLAVSVEAKWGWAPEGCRVSLTPVEAA